MLVSLLLFAGAGVLALMALTGEGGRRRGEKVPFAVLAGVFFPVTWVVWYVRDELSHGHENVA